MVTFGFGLVHGFGFSFALRESLQFAGSHLLTSLLAFNVGVELGQLLVLVVLLPVLALLFDHVVDERVGHHHPVGVRGPHRVALADASGGACWCSIRLQWPVFDLAFAGRAAALGDAGWCWRCWRRGWCGRWSGRGAAPRQPSRRASRLTAAAPRATLGRALSSASRRQL